MAARNRTGHEQRSGDAAGRPKRAWPTGWSRRGKVVAILVAWFFATGSQWDLVQTYGWGRMVVHYAAGMPLVEAVQRAFSGEMCAVCKAVDEAQRQANDSGVPPGSAKGKLVLVSPPAEQTIFAVAESAPWSRCEFEPLSTARAAPPTPPPRAA